MFAEKTIVKLEPTSVQAIATSVADIAATKGPTIDRIATTINEVKGKLEDRKFDDIVHTNRKVLENLENVKVISESFTNGLSKLENIFENGIMKEVATNSEKSVSALNSLNNNVEKFLSKLDIKSNTVDSNKEPVINILEDTRDDIEETKVRKGKLFSSSVALGCNKEKLELELGCDLEIVETYHIIENPTAPNPEKYLDNMLKTHLKPGDVDFIVICVGSNDITVLNSDKSEVTLNKEAIEHSSVIAEIAFQVSERLNIDVFVTARPARYDRKEKDPKGLKSQLNQSANGMQVALISVLEKVHTVHLPALENLTDKAKKELFKNDGIHLTKVGLSALEDNIIKGIKSVYTDIKETKYSDENRPREESGRHGPGRHGPDRHGPGRQEPGDHGPGGGYRPQNRQAGGGYSRRQFPDQPRNSWRGGHNNNRQMYEMQNIMRDFMMYMDRSPSRFRGRDRY